MAKLTWTKRSFSAGELSPSICQSRIDLPIHAQCFTKSSNVIPLQTGALIHRPNTISFPDLELPSDARRIIPFYTADDTHVLLVFGDKKLSFVWVEGGAPPELRKTVGTPYDQWDTSELSYAISGDLMVIVHCRWPPYQAKIINKDTCEFSEMPFSQLPWLGERVINGGVSEANLTVKFSDVTPSEQVKNPSYRVVASSPIFDKQKDEGRYLRLGLLPISWKPKTFYKEGSYISRYGKVYQSVTEGLSGAEWLDNIQDTFIDDGSVQWKVVYGIHAPSSKADGDKKDRKDTSIAGVVPYYYVFGQIKTVSNEKDVGVVFDTSFTCTSDQTTSKWHLGAYDSRVNGYPSQGTFYQGRLVFSGTKVDATSIYLSEYENFNSFSPDGDYGVSDYLKALSVSVTDDKVREIRWIIPMGNELLIGCDSSLWFFYLDLERGFNLIMRKLSGFGVYSSSPIVVGDYVVFACGSGRSIKAVMGSFEQGFKFADLTQFVDHLFTYRIKQLVYQSEPYSLIWVSDRSDIMDTGGGSLFGCRFNPEEENFAWHAHNLGTSGILDMTVFPSIDRGQTDLWLLVSKMGANNSSQVTLERLERFHSEDNYHMDGDIQIRRSV